VVGWNYLTLDFDARHFTFVALDFKEFDVSNQQAPVLLTEDVVTGGNLSGFGTVGLGRKEMNFTYVGDLALAPQRLG
jgi:hypothetical protein